MCKDVTNSHKNLCSESYHIALFKRAVGTVSLSESPRWKGSPSFFHFGVNTFVIYKSYQCA